jgi:hypothetical protein
MHSSRLNRFAIAFAAALTACTTDAPKTSTDSATVSPTTQTSAATPDTQVATVPPAAPPPAPEPTAPRDTGVIPPLANGWAVRPAGIGPVKAGMSVEAANNALGGTLAIPAKLSECDYVRPKSEPKHLAFMVESGKVSRVEVQPGSTITTAEGAKIGDTEERIKTLYPGVEVRPAKYGTGHTLVMTPKDGGNNRIVFETDGKKVVSYRSGRMPAVEYVEGCG